jgi:hypothetical protein
MYLTSFSVHGVIYFPLCGKQSLDSYLPFTGKETEAGDGNASSLRLPSCKSGWVNPNPSSGSFAVHYFTQWYNVGKKVFMAKIKNRDAHEKKKMTEIQEKEKKRDRYM